MSSILGIIGYNFCGSTLLSRLLGSLQGVEPCGEVHWAFDPNAANEIISAAGWPIRRTCVTCGPTCPVFNEKFAKTRFDKRSYYDIIAKKLDCEVLVVSDKLPQHYKRFRKPGSMDGIVLYKSPQAAAWSDIKNERRSIRESLERWTRLYEEILRWAPSFCNKLMFLSYDEMSRNPIETLRRIHSHFVLSGSIDPHVDIDAISYHFVGGNPGGHQKKGIKQDVSSKTGLDENMKYVIGQNLKATKTFERLESAKNK